MLKVENINVYYGQIHAIKDVSFEVKPGEIVSLIGANGAGKSTILKTVSGLLRSKTGHIIFKGEDIGRTEAYKLVPKGLAHVPEGRRIFLQMTVKENLEMGAYTKGENMAEDIETVYKHFPRLKERQNQIAGTLWVLHLSLFRASLTSSRNSTKWAQQSFLLNRMPKWHFPSLTEHTFWKADASFSQAQAKNSKPVTKSKKLILAAHSPPTNTNTEKHRLSLTPLTAGVFLYKDYY